MYTTSFNVDLNVEATSNLLIQSLNKIGKYKATESSSPERIILKAKSHFGLQSIPLSIQIDKIAESNSKVTIEAKSDDVASIGAKKCVERLVTTFNVLKTNNPEQIQIVNQSTFKNKTGFTKTGALALALVITLVITIILLIVAVINDKPSPVGKFYLNNNTGEEYGFGASADRSKSYLTYVHIFYDFGIASPRSEQREGIFSFKNNVVKCTFSDGLPPYKLYFKKVGGDWCIVDENNVVFQIDVPKDYSK